RNDFSDEDEDIDEDKTVDEKRLRHFERMVNVAGELNAHMSSRGDAASITSESASSVNSIIIPQLSETGLETIDEIHEFNTPYTTDGTTNT
ncbi:hypothetical protein, partial [Salmonella sp. s55004]|uniref:hypothetical protein n=1 Tax=Salmonella sp. s55004 TaxID=3159675 RepID=UPI00397EF295